MDKKAFTLIELIATIAIVAVVAVITVPIIINVVQNARRDAFVESAYALVDAANNYHATARMNNKINTLNITYPDDSKVLSTSGQLPDAGNLRLSYEGDVELKIWSDRAKICVGKTAEGDKVEVLDLKKEQCHL